MSADKPENEDFLDHLPAFRKESSTTYRGPVPTAPAATGPRRCYTIEWMDRGLRAAEGVLAEDPDGK